MSALSKPKCGPPPTPSRFRRVGSVVGREFAAYFATPVAAVFLVMFVALSALLAFQVGGLYQRGQADLRPFFQWQPWLALFFMPVLGMRLWSDERRSGSIELLLTLPLAIGDIVIGKFIAAWAFACFALLLTVPIWITVAWLGGPDHGAILSGYIATALLFASLLSVSACASACTRNSVVAFVLALTVDFLLLASGLPIVLDFLGRQSPAWAVDAVASMSALSHFDGAVRGVLDARDVLYPVSVSVCALWMNARIVSWRGAA
ncbi:MAG: ABC transporter permease [Planctomycetes bacterium]|nr:ABC transporter permease [Planctomycetota bacterium]